MKEELEGFKVVWVNIDTGKYESITCNCTRGNAGRIYPIGQRVRPKRGCGPLGVWETCGEARNHLHGQYQNVIFRCTYRRSRSKRFWDQTGDWGFGPIGTIYASSVTLLEQVWPEEAPES